MTAKTEKESTTELVAKQESVAPLRVTTSQPDPMHMLGAAIERGMSVADLGPLMDLVERDQANKARTAFMAAMADFQAHCPTIKKTSKGDRYNFAGLDEVLRTIRPHLDAAGLSIRFDTELTGDSIITAYCYVMHRDGHTQKNQFAAPIDKAVSKQGNALMNATQQVGSARSYAKRYALMDALNLVGSEFDDDGVSAGAPVPTAEPATAEQLATIQEYRDEDLIPEVTLKWLDKQGALTSKQAETFINKIKKETTKGDK